MKKRRREEEEGRSERGIERGRESEVREREREREREGAAETNNKTQFTDSQGKIRLDNPFILRNSGLNSNLGSLRKKHQHKAILLTWWFVCLVSS